MSRTNPIIALAFLPLTTGIGLVVYILSGMSLPLATAFVGGFAFATAWAVWRHTPLLIRPMVKHRAIIGFLAGIVATIAYDLCRFVFVKLLNLTFWLFDIFAIFGRLLVGTERRGLWRSARARCSTMPTVSDLRWDSYFYSGVPAYSKDYYGQRSWSFSWYRFTRDGLA